MDWHLVLRIVGSGVLAAAAVKAEPRYGWGMTTLVFLIAWAVCNDYWRSM